MTKDTDPSRRPRAPRKTPLALTLKLVGYLTGPRSLTGKAFLWSERRATKALTSLAQSPAYLRLAGAMMRHGFRQQAAANRLVEELLHAARMPALSDVEALQGRIERLLDKVEALESQLEYAAARAEPPTTSASLEGGRA